MGELIGKTISHYRILEQIGVGGMGVVYKAQDTKLDRFVALKFLPPHLADDEEKQRFIHEAKTASALDHPNICNIHEIDETDEGQMFITMAYYEGETLKDKIERGPLHIEDALDIAVQTSEGLAKAHEKGIVHRDLKPANLLLTKDGVVKILDFGLAQSRSQLELTKSGTTLGTVAYMSPQQAMAEKVDARTDIFSFGVILYEMLTGELPFKGEYEQAITYAILNETHEPVSSVRAGLPAEIERIIDKCLQKEPSARYQHGDELLVDLRQVKGASEIRGSARSTSTFPKVSNFRKGVSAAIILLAVVGSIVSYLFFGKKAATSERVPIAVVDFVNQTNEPELNGLSGMLITALEQSRRLDVMSRARMFDELKKMGKPDVTFVDEATGREIARQANVSALAVATIRKFGQLYTIDFKVADPESGDRLFSTKVEGKGQESVPGLIDQLSEKTRIDLKEQEQAVQLASRGVAQVTTTNLEAYQHYFIGEQLVSQNQSTQAVEEYRRAIALDSTFALAYYRLAYALNWDYAEELAKEPLRKAFELIDRIPEKERYLLRALKARTEKGYAAGIPVAKEMEAVYPDDKEMLYFIGDWALHARQYPTAEEYLNRVLALDPGHELALAHLCYTYRLTKQHDKFKSAVDRLAAVHESVALQELGFYHRDLGEYQLAVENFEKAYKRDSTRTNSLNTIAISYMRAHQYDKALEYAQKYLSVNPVPVAYFRISEAYLLMGDLIKAEEILKSGLQRFPNSSWLLGMVGTISAFRGNYEKARAQFEGMLASHHQVGVRRAGFTQLAYFYAYFGQYSKSSEMYDERIAFHRSDRDTNSVAEHTARKAYWLYLGRRDKTKVYRELEKVSQFQNVTSEHYYYNLARLYSLIGDFKKANIAAQQVTDTARQLRIESVAWMAKKEWDKAIAVNKTIIEKWRPEAQTSYGYFSAVCYFEKGELDQAIEEVKKAASFYGWDHAFVYPHSFYLLGKIYEKKGDKQRAIENTEKFLDLWKDADPDLPDLIDAKARLAKLKGTSSK